jgi:hypothetical protein
MRGAARAAAAQHQPDARAATRFGLCERVEAQ